MRRPARRTHVLALALAALLPATLAAQGAPAARGAPGTADAPAARYGVIHFPNSGAEAAQERFLEGVLALHSFMYEDAVEAFRAAQQADPSFALAYWGEAMTYDHPIWQEHDRAAGRAALQRLGVTLSERLHRARTPREQMYLRAAEALYFGPDDPDARDAAYRDAMRKIHEEYPDDYEAAVLYALAILGTHDVHDGDRSDMLEAGRIAERVLDRNPRHPGAAHVVIHAYDSPQHARRGLAAARAYARIAPAAHHALHMPSHIFVQLGMWDELVASNEAAYAASIDWATRHGFAPIRRDHHSLSWLEYGYLQQGRWTEARRTIDSAEAAVRASSGEDARRRPGIVPYMRAVYALETRQRTPIALPAVLSERGGEACVGGAAGTSILSIYAAGVIAARGGAAATADLAHECLRAAADSGGARAPESDIAMAANQLRALIALGERRGEDAVRYIAMAAAAEDSTTPFGPSGWLPSRELYGEILLVLGRGREAAEQFDLALQRTPNRALSLLGRARAAAMSGDRKGAARYYTALAEQWKRADSELEDLPEVLREGGAGRE
jgi:tetratricopeptide (TPR) repeat protein